MASLKGSQNYIWSEAECLGQGASAAVFRGRHKRQGELCAVKTFKNNGRFSIDSWNNELELLRNLNHRNVIRVLAIETETQQRAKVLVMELCVSSVYGMLEEPKYAKGFSEKEFLTVLNDVAEGMKYLRTNKIVHRDIKPGNIMRVLNIDHRSIYKLADFGAARTLSDNANFMSLCGTEEYLHPDLYARAVLRQNNVSEFNQCVDLWSLGATFYHIATGELPFRPFGGRTNVHIMYEMTTNKRSGIISACQKQEGGKIFYNDELPEICLLSSCLKKMLVPMFSGLLENNSELMWSFDRFFVFAENLKSRLDIRVYDSTFAVNRLLYVEPHSKLADLQALIAEHAEIAIPDQLIINTHGMSLMELVAPEADVCTYTQLVMTSQYFVYSTRDVDRMQTEVIDLPEKPNFLSIFQYERDYELALQCYSLCHFTYSLVMSTLEAQRLLNDGVQALKLYLNHCLEEITNSLDPFRTLTTVTQRRAKSLISSHDNMTKMADPTSLSQDAREYFKQMTRILDQPHTFPFEQVNKSIKTFERDIIVHHHEIISRSNIDLYNLSCLAEENACEGRVEHQQDWIQKISARFRRDKNSDTHSYNDEQIHKMERIKLKERIEKVYDVYSQHCQTKLINQHGESYTPVRGLCELSRQIHQLADNIQKKHAEVEQFSLRLTKIETIYENVRGSLLASLKFTEQEDVQTPKDTQMSTDVTVHGRLIRQTTHAFNTLVDIPLNEVDMRSQRVMDFISEISKLKNIHAP